MTSPKKKDGAVKEPAKNTRSMRDSAEKKLADSPEISLELKKQTPEQLVHDLQVHQIELEMQAEELTRAQLALEESRDRFLDLYEFAPIGYLTLTDKARVSEANLTGATLLGTERSRLINARFRKFITPEEFDPWDRYFANVLKLGEKQSCTLMIKRGDGSVFPARLEGVRTSSSGGAITVRIAISDITDIWQIEALRKSEEKFRNVFDWTNDAILLHTLTTEGAPGRFIEMNLVACRMLGYSREELLTMGPPDIVPPELHPQLGDIIRQAQTKDSFLLESRLRRKDGTTFPVESSGHLVNSGGMRIWISHIRDISERKRAEEALRQVNAYNRGLIETSLDPFVTIGPDGKITDANVATEVATGHLRKQLIGTDFSDYFTEPEKARAGYLQVFREGQVRDFPLVLRHREGHVTPVLYNATVYRDESGNVTGIFAAARDITGLREKERKLKESEERFSQVAGSAGEWIWEVDADGLYTYSSPAVEKMLGYRPDEIVGRMHFYDLFAPEVKEDLKRTALDAFAGKKHFQNFVNTARHKNDTRVILETSGVPRLDNEGRLIGYRGADTDITARKNAEDALLKSRTQYRELVENISDVILTLDLNGTVTYISPVVHRLFGYTVPEVVGQHFRHFVHPEDVSRVLEGFRRRVEGEYSPNEFRLLTKDGEERYVRTTQTPVMKEGVVTRLNYTMTDITGRKNAEITIQQLLQFQKSALMSANVLLFVIGPDAIVKLWNKAAEGITGYLEGEVVGSNAIWRQLYPDDEYRRQITGKILHIINDNNFLENLETTVRCRNGDKKIISWNTRAMMDETGGLSGYIAIGLDITERKRAEEALRESDNRYRQLVDNTDTGFVVIDDRGIVIEANEPYMHLIGAEKKEDLIGHSVIEWTAPGEQDSNAAAGALCVRQGFIQDFETVYLHRNGTHVHIIINATTQDTPGGKRIISFCRNITERRKAEEGLNESEQRYRSLFENANEGIFIADIETMKFVHANPAICRMLGYSNEELITMSVVDIHPKESLDYVFGEFLKLARDETGVVTDIPCLRKDGTIRTMNIASSRVTMQGRMYLAGLFTDITERKKAEEALQKSRAQYRQLVENISDVILTLDLEGTITYISPVVRGLFGYTVQEVVGQHFTQFVHPEDSLLATEGFRQRVNGEFSPNEFRILTKDGENRYVRTTQTPVMADDVITGFNFVISDITGRRVAEEALKKSEEKFRHVFDRANDAILLHTLTTDTTPGRFIEVNVVACRMLGYTRDEMLTMGPPDIVPAELHPQLAEIVRQAQTEDTFLFETKLRSKDGTTIPVESSGHLIPFNGTKIWISHVRDITERRKVEEALSESEEKFRLLYKNSMDAISLTSTDGSIQAANPAACAMLQRTEDEIIQLGRAGVLDTTDPRLPAAIKVRERTGRFEGELTIVRKDKQRFPGEITSSVFADRNGQKRTSIIVRDITERKRFEEKLQQGIEEKTATIRESELRHRLLFMSSRDAIMTIEPPDWRFTSGNPATVAMFCAEDESGFTSKAPWELSPEFQPDGRPSGEKAKEQIEKAVREGSNYFEWTHRRLTGDEFPATVLLTRFEWKGKEILQATVRDISGQNHAEEERRKSERKFRAIFDQTFQFIGLMTPDGILVEANRTALQFSGIRESDVIGKPFWETPWWTHSGELQEKLRAAVLDAAKGEFVRFEATHIAADGHIHYVDFSLKPVKDEAGHVILLIPEGRDITGQKQAEDKIKASLADKVLLLREIHHRVKNNLQIIISLVNLQMRQIDDERLKQVMAETQNRVRAMAFVHEKLYQSEDIARIDLANYTRLLVTRLFSFYGTDSRQVALKIDIGKIMLSINTAIPLGLIINELASNALKHAFCGGRKGTLSIMVREEDTTLYLTVKSDGAGIPADFDWRNTESLGLRLVVSLVEQLDGTIELDRGAGTEFTIVVQEKD